MSQHWTTVTESAFPWERAALTYLRERLPEQEPWRAWTWTHEGRVYTDDNPLLLANRALRQV